MNEIIADCTQRLEALSALVDGETSPEETRELQQHLGECADCRSLYAAMAGLGQELFQSPPLGADFTRRAASFVRQRSRAPLPPGPGGPRPGGWAGWKRLWNHPVRRLAAPSRRRQLKLGPRRLFQLLLLFGVPSLLMSLLRDSLQLETFLMVASVGLLVGIPVRHFGAEVSILGSLRRGRCLEEILGTGIDPAGLVDVLATQGLGELIKACLVVLPALVLGGLALPARLQGVACTGTLLWLPAVVLLFLAGSYVTQFVLSWSGATRMLGLGGLVVVAPLLGLTLGLRQLSASESLASASLGVNLEVWLVGLSLGALWVSWVARRLAVWGLQEPHTVARWSRRGGNHQRRLVQFSSNPITRRELARISGSVGQGARGLLLWRLSATVVPLAWAGWASTQGEGWGLAFWIGVALFSLGIFYRSASRTLGAVVQEREQRSWELLLQTPLGLSTFVSGWLQVTLYTVGLESLFGLVVLGLFGGLAPGWLVEDGDRWHGLSLLLLSALALMASCLVGSLVGLALSASSSDRRTAGARLVRTSLTALGVGLLSWSLYAVAFVPLMRETGQSMWLDLLWHDLPLTALVTTEAGLGLWSWRKLSSCLQLLETSQTVAVPGAGRYPISLVPLEFSSLGYLTYLGLAVMLVTGSLRVDADSFHPLLLSIGLLGMVALWVGLVRLPLARLAELQLGRWSSLAVGALTGALAGASLPLALNSFRYMLQNNLVSTSLSGGLSPHALDFLFPLQPDTFVAGMEIGACLGLVPGWLALRSPAPDRERKARLRRQLGVSALVSLAGVGLGALLSFRLNCPLENPAATERALESARQRSRALAQIPASQNGYSLLSPIPLPLVKLAGVYDSSVGLSRARQLKALSEPKAEAQRAELEQQLPLLQQALARPRFALPGQLDSFSSRPSSWWMREVADSLAGLGLSREGKGDWNGAFEAYLMGLRWGQPLSGQGRISQQVLVLNLRETALHRMLVLQQVHRLTPGQNQRLLTTLAAYPIESSDLAAALENELAACWIFLEQSGAERGASNALAGLPLPSAYLVSQRNLLANAYVGWIETLGKGGLEQLSLAGEPVLKEAGLPGLASLLVIHPERSNRIFADLLVKTRACQAVATLQLNRPLQPWLSQARLRLVLDRSGQPTFWGPQFGKLNRLTEVRVFPTAEGQ